MKFIGYIIYCDFIVVIEKYTKNTRFCLICNYVSKITMALQSRCTRFRFAPLSTEKISSMLMRVSSAEKYVFIMNLWYFLILLLSSVQMDEGGRKAIMRLSNGDMRSCLNILQVYIYIIFL